VPDEEADKLMTKILRLKKGAFGPERSKIFKKLSKYKLIVVDEIYNVDSYMFTLLERAHMEVREDKAASLFGGIQLVLLGAPRQKPPINERSNFSVGAVDLTGVADIQLEKYQSCFGRRKSFCEGGSEYVSYCGY
jgi:hypothetical protein